jgi:hypothetical protein
MARTKVEGVADMKIHARFDSLAPVAALAALVLALSACNKPPESPKPDAEPKAAQTEVTQSDSGTTTTFAPPAPEPQSAPTAAQ